MFFSNIYTLSKNGSKWELTNGHSLLLIGIDAGKYLFKDSYDHNTDDATNKFIKTIPVNRRTTNIVQLLDADIADSSYNKDDYFIYDYGYALKFARK